MIATISTLGKIGNVQLSKKLVLNRQVEIMPNVILLPKRINKKTNNAKVGVWCKESIISDFDSVVAKTECGYYAIIGQTQLSFTSLAVAMHKNKLHRL